MVASRRGLTHRSKKACRITDSLWPSAINPATILPKGPLNASIKLRTRNRRDSSAVRTVGFSRLRAIRSESIASTKVALLGHHLYRVGLPTRSEEHTSEI